MPTLAAAESALVRLTGLPVRGFSTHDFGRSRDTNHRSVVVAENQAQDLLHRLRPQLPDGVRAFIGTSRWLGDEQHDGVELVVAIAASQMDMLRVARSDAINYGMETEGLVSKLQELEASLGIDIFHAETDTIEFTLGRMPQDMAAFCAALYELCPDIVDQGSGSVEDLRQQVEATRRVYLWWD